ncbi:cell division cycle- protein [Dermatophagoides pteronyssinus]|uniref:Cell division cycle- protein n=1 Tax=Dermatophagoides pteronyssinus TaxID=6956 RepID=A0ABQ8IVC4_DERPT|nr:cell division cycle- protein [Dermatophagoides pteronyssinus]
MSTIDTENDIKVMDDTNNNNIERKKRNVRIQFDLANDDDNDNDNGEQQQIINDDNRRRRRSNDDNVHHDHQKSGWAKFRFSLKKKQVNKNHSKQQQPNQSKEIIAKNKFDEKSIRKQKLKLIKYLSTEEPIMKNINIDDYERRLLTAQQQQQQSSSNNEVNNIDVNKYFRIPESKINDKLWRIPYHFATDDDDDDDDVDDGINDGCMIGLNLPKIQTKQKRFKTWDKLIECSDEILYRFVNPITNGSGSQRRNRRRGSILQPRHVFLMPNPEMGSLIASNLNKNQLFREWSSELMLDVRHDCGGEELLESDYRQNILNNISMDDLSNMIYPELKLSFNVNGMISDSEMRYIQAVSNRRRQSLVPPTFGGGGSDPLQFRRQSFGGGQLWSFDVERQQQRECYQDKIALINPEHRQRRQQEFNRLNSMATQSSIVSTITTTASDTDDDDNNSSVNNDDDDNDESMEFDPESDQQIILFANELSIMIRKYFNSIKSSEIIHFILNITNAMKTCTHIKGLFHFQNRIVRLIATNILNNHQLEQRVRSILFFIRVIRHLQTLNNWLAINLVTKSLQCPPVVRLKDTWRKITFNHPEDYCNFIQISEDLESGNQWLAYESGQRFLPIFDDTIEMIKEHCGLMIVQLKQHRFHQSWHNHGRSDDHNLINWINNEVDNLLKDCGQQQLGLMVNDNDDNHLTTEQRRPKQQQQSSSSTIFKKPKAFLHRIFSRNDKANGHENDGDGNDNRQLYDDEDIQDIDDDDDDYDVHQRRLLKGSKNELTNIVRRRRTSKTNRKISVEQINLNQKNQNNNLQWSSSLSMPSCKRFWTLAEFYKLRQSDREMIKQQIVRTMVSVQKKTFYVFEERDERIRNFLLNAHCNSMDQCMRLSQQIENQEQQQRQQLVNQATNRSNIFDDNRTKLLIINGNHNHDDDGQEDSNNNNESKQQQQQQAKPKRKKVMFS